MASRPQQTSFAVTVVVLLGVLHFNLGASADDFKPIDSDRETTRNVLKTLQEKHLLKLPFDRRTATEALERYLEDLDPLKLYFLQEDISEFNGRKFDLADELKEGDISIAFDVFQRYRQRAMEAAKLWEEFLLPESHDFTKEEVVIVDAKSRSYARDRSVFREQWRLWCKYELLFIKCNDRLSPADLRSAFADKLSSYRRVARASERTNKQQVLEYFFGSICAVHDANTFYSSPLSAEDLQITQRGNLSGIGASISGMLAVDMIYSGGPADKDGRLKKGDILEKIGEGESGTLNEVSHLTLREVVSMIRGPEGSTVRIIVRRPGENQTRTVVLKRGKVVIPQSVVESKILTSFGRKLGYIDVPSFYWDSSTGSSTVTAVEAILQEFKKEGVACVVLDLRRCGGGYLNQSVGLAGLFLGKCPLLQIKDQSGQVKTNENVDTEMAWTKPVVVVVGRNTGSGAEIVCGAIQDYQRGLVIGDDATFGRGLIGTQVDLPQDGGMMQVTTAQFYRVSGDGIQQRGISPDILVPSMATVYPRPTNSGDTHLGFDRTKSLPIGSQLMVPEEVVLKLRGASRERRRSSSQFRQLQSATEWQQAQAVSSVESLKEEEFRSKRKDSPVKGLESLPTGDADIFVSEVWAIAADYVGEIGSKSATPPSLVVTVAKEDPETIRQRAIANQRESARQSVLRLEEEISNLNNQVVAAQLALVVAKKVYDDAPAGSANEILAELAYIAADRTLAELKAEVRRKQSELDSASSTYNRLR